MKTEYKHIRFQDLSAQYPRRKTSTYNCWNHSEILLGCVEWKSGWRQYIFEPNQAVFSAGCLQDISHFIKQLMDAR